MPHPLPALTLTLDVSLFTCICLFCKHLKRPSAESAKLLCIHKKMYVPVYVYMLHQFLMGGRGLLLAMPTNSQACRLHFFIYRRREIVLYAGMWGCWGVQGAVMGGNSGWSGEGHPVATTGFSG